MDVIQGVPWTPPESLESLTMPDPAVPIEAVTGDENMRAEQRAHGLGFSRYV
jgi:hypothetical protein